MTEVKKGQVWIDTDPRMEGRELIVERVEPPYAYCLSIGGAGLYQRSTRIRLSRLQNTIGKRGYRLKVES